MVKAYPEVRKNKFTWIYRFMYWNRNIGRLYLYTISTDKGLQVAESAAWGNAQFDGCTNMKYLGRNKEVEDGTTTNA